VAPVFRTAALATGIFGLGQMMAGGSDRLFLYFTTQTNVFVLLMWLCELVLAGVSRVRGRRIDLPMPVKTAVTMYIVITMVVYWAILGGTFTMNGTLGSANIILHAVVPLAAVLDWLVFGRHGRVRWKHTPCFLCYPLAYMIFTFVRAAAAAEGEAFYPYPFMDVTARGVPTVAVTMVIMGIAFWLLGALFKGFDGLLSRKQAG